MPRAVVNAESQERFDLKTLPSVDGEEGGYVVIRRMSFGEYQRRRTFTSDMRVKGGTKKDDFEGIMQLMNEKVTYYEFAKCVVDHNLTGDGDEPLDLTKERDVNRLDPRVGEEISTYIDKMNKWDEEGEDELGN